MNIYQRLNEIRREVAYVQKDKSVQDQYKAVSHDAVTASLRESLIKHGVMIAPTLVKSNVVDSGSVTSKKVPIIRYEATYDIVFVNCEEPEQKVVVSMEAHALDHGDKAPGKAISYATKYAMLKLFSIETGEDEEDRPEIKAAKLRITPTSGVEDVVSKDDQEKAHRLIGTIVDAIDAGMPEEALQAIDDEKLETETRVFLWKNLDSKTRSLLTKTRERMKLENAKKGFINDAQRKRLEARIGESGVSRDKVKEYVKATFGKDHFSELTQSEYDQVDNALESLLLAEQA